MKKASGLGGNQTLIMLRLVGNMAQHQTGFKNKTKQNDEQTSKTKAIFPSATPVRGSRSTHTSGLNTSRCWDPSLLSSPWFL